MNKDIYKDIYKEYKSIEEELNELDELEDNIKRLRENLKEIEGPKGLYKLEKKYVEKHKTTKERIQYMNEILFDHHKKDT